MLLPLLVVVSMPVFDVSVVAGCGVLQQIKVPAMAAMPRIFFMSFVFVILIFDEVVKRKGYKACFKGQGSVFRLYSRCMFKNCA